MLSFLLAFLFSTAIAEDLPPAAVSDGALIDQPSPEPIAEPTPAAPPAASPHEWLALAWKRGHQGDWDGARIAAERAAETPGDHQEEARYTLGFAQEWSRDNAKALATYDQLLSDWPSGSRTVDARFRRAEVLGKMGRHREALAGLRDAVGNGKGLDADDRLKVDLLRGTWELARGKASKGRKLIEASLADAVPTQVPWYQGMARSALADRVALEARARVLRGKPGPDKKTLPKRAQALLDIEAQIDRTIDLAEPRWILEELLTLGAAYDQLGGDLLAAPVPKLPPLSDEIYRKEVARRAETVRVKGLRAYELAIEHAAKVNYVGPERDRCLAARDAIQAAIEGASIEAAATAPTGP